MEVLPSLLSRHAFQRFPIKEGYFENRRVFQAAEASPEAASVDLPSDPKEIQTPSEMAEYLENKMDELGTLEARKKYFQDLAASEVQHVSKVLGPDELRNTFVIAGLSEIKIDKDEIHQLVSEQSTKNVSIIRSLIMNESGGHLFAVSPKEALGLAQMMPSNYADRWEFNPFVPETAVQYAVEYLKEAEKDFLASELNQANHLLATIASYNAGVSRVKEAIENAQKKGDISGFRKHLSKETQEFIKGVLTFSDVSLENMELSEEEKNVMQDARGYSGDMLEKIKAWWRGLEDIPVPAWMDPENYHQQWPLRENSKKTKEYLKKRSEAGKLEKLKSKMDVEEVRGETKSELEQAREAFEQQEKVKSTVEMSWHNAYMNYRDSLLPEKRSEWVGGKDPHPEYFAGNPDEQSVWFDTDGSLNHGVLTSVLDEIIPPKGSIVIDLNGTKQFIPGTALLRMLYLSNEEAKDGKILEAEGIQKGFTHETALGWVEGLEKYIYDQEKKNGIQANTRSAMEEANIDLNKLSNGLGDFGSGLVEKLIDGDATDKAEVAVFAFALWKLYKSSADSVKNLMWGGLGLYVFDKVQAEHTDLFGGQRILDMIAGGQIADIRETPLAAFLHSEKKTSDMEKKAGLVMLEVPIDCLLDWAGNVEAAPEPDLFADSERPKALYYDTMPGMLKANFHQLFPEYKTQNDFQAAETMWQVFEAFLLSSAKKANAFDNNIEVTRAQGLDYLRAKYTGDKISGEFEQYRDHIGRLHTQYATKSPTFSRVLEHEITRREIQKTIAENQTLLEKVISFGKEQWINWVPLLEGTWDWSLEQLGLAMTWLEDTGFPKSEEFIRKLAATGWRISKDGYNRVEGAVTGFFGKEEVQVTLQKIGKGAKWAIIAPFKLGAWTIETVQEKIPDALEKVGHVTAWAGGMFEGAFDLGERGNELISISSGEDILAVLRDSGMANDVMASFGLIRENDLKNLCDAIFDQKGSWMKKILQQKIIRESALQRDWPLAENPEKTGKIQIEDANNMKLPRKLIPQFFFLNIPGLGALQWTADKGTAGVQGLFDGLKMVGKVASLGRNFAEGPLWSGIEAVSPDTSPNIQSIEAMSYIENLIDEKFDSASDEDPISVWRAKHVNQLLIQVLEQFSGPQSETSTVQEQFTARLVREKPSWVLNGLGKSPSKQKVKNKIQDALQEIDSDDILGRDEDLSDKLDDLGLMPSGGEEDENGSGSNGGGRGWLRKTLDWLRRG